MEKRKRQRLKPNRRVSEPQTVSTWQWAVEGYYGPQERFHMCLIVAENPWRVLQGRASQVDSRVWKFPLRVENGFGSRWRARLEAGSLSRWFRCFCLKFPTDLSWVLSKDVLCLQVSSVNLNSGQRGRSTWSQWCGPAVILPLQLGVVCVHSGFWGLGPNCQADKPLVQATQFPCTEHHLSQQPTGVMLTHSSLPLSAKEASLVVTSSSYAMQEFVLYWE